MGTGEGTGARVDDDRVSYKLITGRCAVTPNDAVLGSTIYDAQWSFYPGEPGHLGE